MKFKPALLHFKFINFASLPTGGNACTQSEIQTDCNGHKWYLVVFPRGLASNNAEWTGLYLYCSDIKEPLDTKFILSVKDANGTTVTEEQCNKYFDDENLESGHGQPEILPYSKIIDNANNVLKDGELHIDITIQVKDDEDYGFPPESEHSNNMLNLLTSRENADVSFKIKRKVFRAHSLILNANAPILASSCSVTIKGMKPEVFQLLLEYIYSGRQPTKEHILEYGKGLIDAANRYELIELKTFVEKVLVGERIVTKENVADYILFADAQSCPLMKDYGISFFLLHHREVLKSDHSKCLKESGKLLSEIMMLMDSRSDRTENMTVYELNTVSVKRKLDTAGPKDSKKCRLYREECNEMPQMVHEECTTRRDLNRLTFDEILSMHTDTTFNLLVGSAARGEDSVPIIAMAAARKFTMTHMRSTNARLKITSGQYVSDGVLKAKMLSAEQAAVQKYVKQKDLLRKSKKATE